MATSIVAGNILVTEVVCTVPGQIAVHRLYHRVMLFVGTPAVTTADVALQIDTDLAPKLKSLMAPYAEYYGVQTRVVWPISNERWVPSTTLSGVGTATGNPLPTQSCGLLALVGSVLGGAGAGRWYLPFPSAADDDTTASPGATYLTNMTTLGTWVKTPLAVASNPAGGVATLQSVLFNTTTKVDNLVTDVRNRDAWATQYRRSAFGRLNKLPF